MSHVALQRGAPRDLPYDSGDGQAHYYRMWSATAEAVWSLIGQGFVVPASAGQETRYEHDTQVVAPNHVRLSARGRDWLASGELVIRDADMFLRDLPPMSQRVKRCLREAVEAYRRGLPLACVILLGAASEAGWNLIATEMQARWPGESEAIARADSLQARQAAALKTLRQLPKPQRSEILRLLAAIRTISSSSPASMRTSGTTLSTTTSRRSRSALS